LALVVMFHTLDFAAFRRDDLDLRAFGFECLARLEQLGLLEPVRRHDRDALALQRFYHLSLHHRKPTGRSSGHRRGSRAAYLWCPPLCPPCLPSPCIPPCHAPEWTPPARQ